MNSNSISVYPAIRADLKSQGIPLKPKRVVIPGSRVLAEASDGERDWMLDLPVGAAIKAPASLDLSDSSVHFDLPHTQWYADQLRQAYAERDASETITPTATVRKPSRDIVIVNCIDHLYGHCLFKLLNCDYHHQREPDVGICVLIQPQLRDLVPDYVAEVWEVAVPLRDGVRWFDSIDRWINDRLPQYDSVSVSRAYSHLSSRYYDINHFTAHRIEELASLKGRTPIIHFSCRLDRCWGLNAAMQEKRLQKLYFELRRRYENLALVISGFGKPSTKPGDDPWWSGWVDLRTENFTKEKEDQWLSSMAASDLAVGVHGSNMLLPTAFVDSAVIMMTLAKYDGIGLDVLTPHVRKDSLVQPREEMLKYAFVYGDDALLDVSPKRLAEIIANKLGYSRINLQWFQFGPDHEPNEVLQSMLANRERVAAVHRVERNNAIGTVKSTLHRWCIRMAAALE